ncbi:hypothetical protein F0562_032439 [Nyssa sinensis]|uniref:Uncharacterized protein n=1 Tax=Nyssa sinensis TaxID=561372 RepID=A0A5J5ARL1_9ASTE|nr:hypothetical protein F0562_032439 [Nyssa sinensis]
MSRAIASRLSKLESEAGERGKEATEERWWVRQLPTAWHRKPLIRRWLRFLGWKIYDLAMSWCWKNDGGGAKELSLSVRLGLGRSDFVDPTARMFGGEVGNWAIMCVSCYGDGETVQNFAADVAGLVRSWSRTEGKLGTAGENWEKRKEKRQRSRSDDKGSG